ncbi:BC1881 family protein [Neobacillus sp. MM2021_6]|uniref:BC1881 family protein n=1 Tax=Bacillaceae TaxID=186817 RepID=UPI00140962CB|nr:MULTISPECIES: BC1881 family protein [Bacillaceae]MBO0962009.1 BC1881 family protein [Neobacillus sp. MM2021_6]NHC20296.1 BC1881 family protein [Bacillus sp. MM2020_4]
MAEKRESNKGLSVKVDVDVSDALKSLKALKRETNDVIKGLDTLTRSLQETRLISLFTTAELQDELIKRTGVKEYVIDAHGRGAKIQIDNGHEVGMVLVEGPARIIVNTD